MLGILKDNIDLTYNFQVRHFESLTLVTVTCHSWHVVMMEEEKEQSYLNNLTSLVRSSKTTSYNICITRSHFDHMIRAHGANPRWLLEMNEDDHEIKAISQEFYDAYLDNKHEDRKWYGKDHNVPALPVLEAGKFHLMVRDKIGWDGYLYTPENEAVGRPIHVDWIHSRFTNENYKLNKLKEHLSKNRAVRDIVIETVPDYDGDSPNRKSLEFVFIPNGAQMKEITSHDGLHRYEKIVGWLGVSEFAREKDED